MYFKYTYYLDPNFSVYTKDTFNLYSYVPIQAQNVQFQIKNINNIQPNQNNNINNQNNMQSQNKVKEYEKYEKVPINILKLDFTDLNVGSPEYIPGKVWSPISSNTSSPVSSNTPSPNISPRKHITVYENKQSSPRRYYNTHRRRN